MRPQTFLQDDEGFRFWKRIYGRIGISRDGCNMSCLLEFQDATSRWALQPIDLRQVHGIAVAEVGFRCGVLGAYEGS